MKENREELEARIAAYIDGQLPPSEAARLEVFLANTDPGLAQQVIGMIAERHAVRALPKVKAPGDLSARIMEQVERTSLLNDVEHFSIPRRPWWQSRFAVAAALLLVLGGFAFFILEAVRRPTSPWRETVMDSDAARRELAAAPPSQLKEKASPPAQSGPGIAGLDAVKSEAAEKAATGIPAPSAAPAGSLASATPAAATPASTSTIQAAKALPSAPSPVRITLLARDEQDYSRLRTELEQFASANPDAPRNGLLTNGAPALEAQATRTTGQQFGIDQTNTLAGPLAQNNSNANEQFAARAAKAPSQTQDGAANQSDVARQGNVNIPAGMAPAKGAGEPTTLQYRAALHPDQVRQLANDFQVQSPAQDRLSLAAPAAAEGAIGGASGNPVAAKDLADRKRDKTSDVWIDCLITLLPPPPASPAASTSSSPANSSPSSQPATQPR